MERISPLSGSPKTESLGDFSSNLPLPCFRGIGVKGFEVCEGSDKNEFYARRIGEDTKGRQRRYVSNCAELIYDMVRCRRTQTGVKGSPVDGQMPPVTPG